MDFRLLESQMLHHLIHSSYYVIRTDLQGKYTYVNPLFAQRFSYMTGNFIGMPFQATIHAGDVEACDRAAVTCMAEPGKKVRLKVRKLDQEGLFYWTAWEFTALTDEQNSPYEILCLGNDVTEAVEAETNFIKTVLERDKILDNITDAFLLIDREWRVIKVNHTFEKILNVKQENQIGRNLWELFPDAVHLKFYSEARRAMQEHTSVHYEEFYPAYNRWFAASVYPSDEGLTIFFRDITEKKKKEAELRNSLYKLKAILNSTTDFNFFLNPDYSIVSFNRKAADNARRVLGQPLSEGCNILNYIPEGQLNRFKALFLRAVSGEQVEEEYEMVLTPEKSVWFLSGFHPVRDDDSLIIGVSLSISDITEQKLAQTQIHVQNEKLLEVTRVQSHDLRRPVANILGLIYLFNSEKPDYEFNRTLIESLQLSVEEMDKIIHQIVDLTQEL